MRNNESHRRSSLTAQFVGLIAGVLFLSMGLNIYLQYRTESRLIDESIHARGQSLVELLASFSIESLLINDIVTLNEYAENTSEHKDVRFVLITDNTGDKLIGHAANESDGNSLRLIRKINYTDTESIFTQFDNVVVFQSEVTFIDKTLARTFLGLDKSSYQRKLAQNLIPQIILTLLTGFFVGLGVYFVFERKVWDPVKQLREGANKISNLDFTEKIEFDANNELSDVAESFNYMSQQLEENIAARDQAMSQLANVNDTLEERIRLRTSEMENLAATMAHQAMHDPLTGLANRVLIVERLQHAIMLSQRKSQRTAFMILDLNNFKEVNDTMGHPEGDVILKEVAARLPGTLRDSDTVGRLGGDEFAVVLPEIDEDQALVVGQKILNCFDENFELDTQEISLGVSIGIAVYPDHGDDHDALIRHADVAMYDAKRNGTGMVVYNPEFDQYTQRRLTLMADLRSAIEKDQLILHYQPQINLVNNKVESVEALVRWNHPEQGLIPPDHFIHIAESSGVINMLSEWVLTEAITQWRQWQDEGHNLHIAINLSVKNLINEELPDILENLCEKHAVTKGAIRLEITESAIMQNPGRVLDLMGRTGLSKFQYAIDDFGTGYSSLSYLKKLRVNEVKIDKSFVQDMDMNDEDATIVRSVIDLAHNLGHIVVAEGVENPAVLKLLMDLECDFAQGYLFSRPVPADQIPASIYEIENKVVIKRLTKVSS